MSDDNQHWAHLINRVLRSQIEYRRVIARAVGEVLSSEPPPLPFGSILRSTFDAAVSDPSLEPFDDDVSQGRFAAHVVLGWLNELPAAKKLESQECADLAMRHISQCFAHRSAEFETALASEFTALTAG